MAVFNGFIVGDKETAVSPLRPLWMDSIDHTDTGSGIDVLPPISGVFTSNQPINPMPQILSAGFLVPTYTNDFYGKVLIDPVFISFDSVVTNQIKSISVFNGYFINKTLNGINLNDFDSGMSFTGDTTPAAYLPLEERTHFVNVDTEGPPNISASINYDWEGSGDDITVNITGIRIVLLPVTFKVNADEKLTWGTNVLNSRNGTEQRVRTRNKPRQELKIQAYLNNEDRIKIENVMYGRLGGEWAIPMWIESRYGGPIATGATVISVSTLYGDFRVGGLVLIWENTKKYEVFLVDAITDNSITIRGTVSQGLDNPQIMPVRKAIANSKPRRNTTGYDGMFSGSFLIIDNIRLPENPSTEQYLGEDVYLEQPTTSKKTGITDIYDTRTDLIDFSTGSFSQVAPWENIRINRQFELIIDGLESIWNFRLWLHRRAGMLVPFYMPTFENNLLIETEGNISDNFLARNDKYSGNATGRNKIAFYLKNETWVFKNIINSGLTGGGQELITIDSALNVDVSEIEFVSYMGLKRLSTDSFQIKWLGNNVVSVNISITEIKP